MFPSKEKKSVDVKRHYHFQDYLNVIVTVTLYRFKRTES